MQLNLYKDGTLFKENASAQEIVDALTPETAYKFTLTQTVNGKESDQSAPLNVTTFKDPTAKEIAIKRAGQRITSLSITTGDTIDLEVVGLEDNKELTGADLQYVATAKDDTTLTITQSDSKKDILTLTAQAKSDGNAVNMTKVTSNTYALSDLSLPVNIAALDVPQAPELVWASNDHVVLKIYNKDAEAKTLNLFSNGELISGN